MDGTNYAKVPLSIRQTDAALAARAVQHNPVNYMYVPPEIKAGNWDLAHAALSHRRQAYNEVPIEMRDTARTRDSAERERMVELARQATRFQPLPATATPDQRRRFLLEHTTQIANPDLLRESEVPPATKRNLLTHLYSTNRHTHLRDLGEYTQTREALDGLNDTTGKFFQRISLTAPPAEPDPDPRNPPHTRLPNLSADTLRKITEHANVIKSKEEDHKIWSEICFRDLWAWFDNFLYIARVQQAVHYFVFLNRAIVKLNYLITYFCDPHNAWAVNEDDAPTLEPLPLTDAQRSLAFDSVVSVYSMHYAITHHLLPFLQNVRFALLIPQDITVRFGQILNRLRDVAPDAWPLDRIHQWTTHVDAYLNKPPAVTETLFSEDYPAIYPQFRVATQHLL